MPLLGAHMSVAGGYFRAVEAAAELGMETVQIFTVSPQMWPVPPPKLPPRGRGKIQDGPTFPARPPLKPIAKDQAEKFRDALSAGNISRPIAHSSYLINLASPNPILWQRSVDALLLELDRATSLGIDGVVVHPGAAVGIAVDEGIANVIKAINSIHQRRKIGSAEVVLENTAGQGSCLGWDFAHLKAIIDGVRTPQRLTVCIDTCHAFAAGYPLSSAAEYRRTMNQLDAAVGLSRVRGFHLNDSAKPFGSRRDRHAHIGCGQIGREAFRRLLRDRRFRDVPMYLETEKGEVRGESWDAVNLRTLRELM